MRRRCSTGCSARGCPRSAGSASATRSTRKGGVVSEFTVTRLAEDRFYLVCASTAEWHDEDLLRAALPADGSARLEPRARPARHAGDRRPRRARGAAAGDLGRPLQRRLPLARRRARSSSASAAALALRVNYVGELGWELHLPMEQLLPAYEAVMAAGATRGIRDVGIYAVESMRLDKCYRSWKQDLETGFSAFEASLDRFVDLAKPDFVGKAALLAERERGVRQRLVPLTLDEPGEADAPFCAPVHAGGERVGLATSGFWSFTLEQSVALAYLRADLAAPGSKVEVEIFGRRVPATVGREPLYDPETRGCGPEPAPCLGRRPRRPPISSTCAGRAGRACRAVLEHGRRAGEAGRGRGLDPDRPLPLPVRDPGRRWLHGRTRGRRARKPAPFGWNGRARRHVPGRRLRHLCHRADPHHRRQRRLRARHHAVHGRAARPRCPGRAGPPHHLARDGRGRLRRRHHRRPRPRLRPHGRHASGARLLPLLRAVQRHLAARPGAWTARPRCCIAAFLSAAACAR